MGEQSSTKGGQIISGILQEFPSVYSTDGMLYALYARITLHI